jgi:hypothetical protein
MKEGLPVPPTTANTLHTLVISNCHSEGIPMLHSLIRLHSSPLKCLFIGGMYPFDERDGIIEDTIAPLPSLGSLIIRDDMLLSDRWCQSLPKSLIDMSLPAWVWQQSSTPCQLISKSSRQWPRLRRIEIYGYMGSVPDVMQRRDDLIQVFEKSGVELSFTEFSCQVLPQWAQLDTTNYVAL